MYGLPLIAFRVVPAQTNLTGCPQPETAVKWIFDAFHQCIYNVKAEVGLCIGLLSICCWMSAGFPQVVANFKTKKVHEAWSIYSLLLWLCGDSCNLTSQLVAGYSIGCVSAVLYLASRVPQILKNFRRKKTDGVCYTLFLLAALGNSLYGTSILLQDPPFGMTRREFLIRQAPWLVGSLGTMVFDSFIISQIFYYTRRQKRLVINGSLVEQGTENREYETIPDVEGGETQVASDKQPLIDADHHVNEATRSKATTTGYQSTS